LDNAKGEYIVFLDADDIYHCNFISALYQTLKDLNVDTAYCLFSRDIKKMSIEEDNPANSVERLSANEVMLNFMYKTMPMGFWTFIYKKAILDNFNIRFTQNIKYGEDLEFTWKYLTHCQTGAALKKPLYGYFDNPKSVVNTVNWRKTDLLTSVARVENYLREANSPFYETYKNYMYSRTIWAVLKTFAQAQRKDLFYKFIAEYDVKRHMKTMCKAPNVLIRISSILYCINPILFYRAAQIL
jgi:glycosyltransferase involved in cell wall biosynthesis